MVIHLSRWSVLLGYFGLLGVTLAWNAWISPSTQVPRALILLCLLTPLLFPLRGLLHGNPYTHAWTTFIAAFYFILGVSSVVIPQERTYGVLQIITSLSLFWGCIFYARCYKGRQLKTQKSAHTNH